MKNFFTTLAKSPAALHLTMSIATLIMAVCSISAYVNPPSWRCSGEPTGSIRIRTANPNEFGETYTAANAFGTDVLAVFCENSLEALTKWSWNFYAHVVYGMEITQDNEPPTNWINQAAEQNKDTYIQNIEAMVSDDRSFSDSYVGLHTFGGDDIVSNFLYNIRPELVAERVSVWVDERFLELRRFAVLYFADACD